MCIYQMLIAGASQFQQNFPKASQRKKFENRCFNECCMRSYARRLCTPAPCHLGWSQYEKLMCWRSAE